MIDSTKDVYNCFTCGHRIVTIQEIEGMVPRILDCTKSQCEGVMHSVFNSRVDVSGKTPTHVFRKDPDHTKLKLHKIHKEVSS